jgi:PTS system nitrogen regulatory IIA component
MIVSDLLIPERTFVWQQVHDKADLLQRLASLAVVPGCHLDEQAVLAAFQARERLGSTGIGEGVAIPHCRLDCCDRPQGILLKLETPVDFHSLDGHPVDLVFALLTPTADADAHLRALSHLAALFNEADYRASLREAASADDLFERAVHTAFESQASL